jgi:hypothetical protein
MFYAGSRSSQQWETAMGGAILQGEATGLWRDLVL